MNDEEGFGCHIEATVFEVLAVAQRQVAPFMLWVLGGTEVKSHGRFDGSLCTPGCVELILGVEA